MDAYGEMPTIVEEFEVEEHQPNVHMATLKSMCKIAWIPIDGPLDGLYKLRDVTHVGCCTTNVWILELRS